MRKLTKTELMALIVADTRGSIRPNQTDALTACLKLSAYHYMREHDNAPGVFTITAAGETRLAQALALKKAA